MMKSEVFENRESYKYIEAYRWLANLLIGVCTGVVAFVMSTLEEFLIEKRTYFVEKIIHKGGSGWLAWAFLAGWCFVLCALASYLTITVGPAANGSGIAELMAYLNGVNYPEIYSYKTLIIKIFCVVLGICGALCIGKEGPLAHIGAAIAVMVIFRFPISTFDYFRNEVDKREFVAAGISAGVSAAFGAPIGGTLFSYEISTPSTFWRFGLIWRIFFCSSVSTFTLSLLSQMRRSGMARITVSSAGTLKFGKLQSLSIPVTHISGAIVLGVMGGVLGSFFISTNTFLTKQRKKYVTTTTRKVLETGLFGLLTITLMTLCIATVGRCQNIPDYDPKDLDKAEYQEEIEQLNHWTCNEDQYSQMATLFLNTESGTIKSLFKDSEYYQMYWLDLFVFGVVWFLCTITTYGVWIPAGLFLPGIIMGGAMGRLYTNVIQHTFSYTDHDELLQNALLGSAAMLSGYCRLTYSLTVLMLETTMAVNLFVPMVITMVVSYLTGILFNQSLYNRALIAKKVPMLID